jgi:hypothetical protein
MDQFDSARLLLEQHLCEPAGLGCIEGPKCRHLATRVEVPGILGKPAPDMAVG